ncbi:MAG TPA: hypothetical protein VH087_21295 [Thermoanaerobaculia bacterium]|jgi:hypothetical protein|nr:hypothetical protein [Thermoanaerobaculia bacterium]
MRTIRIPLFLITIFMAASVLANPFGRYVALVPINPGVVPGVGGSLWTTSLWITNTGDHDVPLFCESEPCPVLKAHSTTLVEHPTFDAAHQGFFLQVQSSIPDPVLPNTLFFELRSTDTVTAPESAGTEIPLVRLSAFSAIKTALPHVPVNGHSRSRLRVYGTANGDVTVRVVGVESNQELLTTTLTLTGVDPAKAVDQPILRYPSFAEIALPESYNSSDAAVRVEIIPSANVSAWGFVSTTDNASQQFTIMAPTTPEYIPISLL